MIKAVIFDKDGTLFDTEKLLVQGWMNAIIKAGGPNDDTIIKGNVGLDILECNKRLEENYGIYGLDNIRKEKEEYVANYIKEFGIPLKPFCIEILEYLKNKNILIGLATSMPGDIALKNLKETKIIDYFDAIATGDMVKRGKPAPDIYLLCAKKLGISPDEALVIEDSMHGIRGANTGGFTSVLIPDQVSPSLAERGLCKYILDSLNDIKSLV